MGVTNKIVDYIVGFDRVVSPQALPWAVDGEVILERRPSKYRRQPDLRYCAGYSLEGVLSSFGLADRKRPSDYLSLFSKITGAGFPKEIANALKEYGLEASIDSSRNLSDDGKVRYIKNELSQGHPIIMAIALDSGREAAYSDKGSKVLGHWISLFGYDNEGVFAYDSWKDPEELPIGNVKIGWRELMEHWKGAFYFRNLFISIPVNGSPKG